MTESVSGLSLVDLSTGAELQDITAAPEISSATLLGETSLRAEVLPAVDQVVFNLDGPVTFETTERRAPFELDLSSLALIPGSYVLQATPYFQIGEQLIPGPPTTYSFSVVEELFEAIRSVQLINAQSDEIIRPLQDNDVIDLTTTGALIDVEVLIDETMTNSIHVLLSNELGEVVFDRIENQSRWAMSGNKGDDFFGWDPSGGSYALSITPYTERNLGGTKGATYEINFTVVGNRTEVISLGVTSDGNSVEVTASDAGSPIIVGAADGVFTASVGDMIESVKFELIGQGGVVHIENVEPFEFDLAEHGIGAGEYVLVITPFTEDEARGDSGAALQFPVTVTIALGVIEGFTLLDASQDVSLFDLSDGAVIDLAEVGDDLNIRAEVGSGPVESVRFILMDDEGNELLNQIENQIEYVMAGNKGADYLSWTPTAGNYVLKAIPYSENQAAGDEGQQLTVSFQVRDSQTAQSIVVSPNPIARGPMKVEFARPIRGSLVLYLVDGSGNTLAEESLFFDQEVTTIVSTIDVSALSLGLHYLTVVGDEVEATSIRLLK